MKSLLRTQVGRFSLEDSKTLQNIQELKENGSLEQILIPVDSLFEDYRRVQVDKKQEPLLYNGNMFYMEGQKDVPYDEEMVRVYDCDGKFVAIYRYNAENNQYKIVKMFFNER